MVLHVNHTSINQVFTKASVLPAFLKANDVKHGTTQLSEAFGCDFEGQPHGEMLLFNAQRAGHPSAPQAAVAIRVLAQVLLVVILGVVERLSLPDVSCDRAVAIL